MYYLRKILYTIFYIITLRKNTYCRQDLICILSQITLVYQFKNIIINSTNILFIVGQPN